MDVNIRVGQQMWQQCLIEPCMPLFLYLDGILELIVAICCQLENAASAIIYKSSNISGEEWTIDF